MDTSACSYEDRGPETPERFQKRITSLAKSSKGVIKAKIVDAPQFLPDRTKNKYLPWYQVRLQIDSWYTEPYSLSSAIYQSVPAKSCGQGNIPTGVSLLMQMDGERISTWWLPDHPDAVALLEALKSVKR